jgi:DNA polymerase
MAYALQGDKPKLWRPGIPIPPEVHHAIVEGWDIRAWNAPFEVSMYRDILVPRYHFPAVPLEQWVDTAAEAKALALPAGLGACAHALRMEHQKDDFGHKLMMQMARPRSYGAYMLHTPDEVHGPFATKGAADGRRKRLRLKPKQCEIIRDESIILWWDDEDRQRKLGAYCLQDVATEMGLAEKLRTLSPDETAVYHLTQRMNDHGVPVDMDLVDAACDMMEISLGDYDEEIRRLTDGVVTQVSQARRILRWVNDRGADLPDMRKDTIRDALAGEIHDPAIRTALEIRAAAGKTSTSKLAAFLQYVGEDNRARGLLAYHVASTGRWAGRGVQPQNFPRPEMRDPEAWIPLILAEDYPTLKREADAAGYSVPQIVSSLLRSMFCAEPGQTFMCADYSQIEARIVAWIAGATELVDLFESGGKVYETMGSYIFDLPVEEIAKDSFERQIGKNSVLGFGFQMGEDRYAGQVREQTGIILDRDRHWHCTDCKSYIAAWHVDDPDGEKAGRCCPTGGREIYQGPNDVAKIAKDTYRERYWQIPLFWKDINAAAINAVQDPGTTYRVGVGATIKFVYKQRVLWCVLPSGRPLAYFNPEIKMRPLPAPYEDILKPTLFFYGVDGMTRQFRRTATYGGHLTENVVQAMARDLMAGGMLRLEHRGYTPILTVHDEVLVQVPEDDADLDSFLEIVTTVPRWAKGLPVAGEAWQGERYRK